MRRISRVLAALTFFAILAGSRPAGAQGAEILLFADGFESGDTAAWTGIGAGGGRIVADGGRVVLDFPRGAVADPIQVTVTPLTPVPHPDMVPGTAYEFGPDGTDFLEPVRLEIEYDPAVLTGPEDELVGAHLETSGDLAHQPSAPVDTDANRVISQIAGFSQRAVAPCPGPCFGPPEITSVYNADRSVTLDWTPRPFAGLVAQIERARVVAGDPCTPGYSRFCIDDGGGNGHYNGLQPPLESQYTLIANVPSALTWTDFLGSQGGVFWYRIRWRASGGTTSSWSNTTRELVFGLQPPPPAPTSVSAQPLRCGGVWVRWSTVFEASGYTVARAGNGQPLQVVATLGGTDSSWIDQPASLAPGATYTYWVRAFNSTGQSGFSVPDTATNAENEFAIGLSSRSLAIPPGGSADVDVLLTRYDDPNLDVDLDYVSDLPGFTAAFSVDPTAGNSVATISVDPAASPALLATMRITGTSLPPGSGATCSILLQVRARPPGCRLQIPDVTIPMFQTSFTDVVIDRWGLGGGIALSDAANLPAFQIFPDFIPNPAIFQSSMGLIYKGPVLTDPAVVTGRVHAAATDGSGATCDREFELTVMP